VQLHRSKQNLRNAEKKRANQSTCKPKATS